MTRSRDKVSLNDQLSYGGAKINYMAGKSGQNYVLKSNTKFCYDLRVAQYSLLKVVIMEKYSKSHISKQPYFSKLFLTLLFFASIK